MRIIDATAAAKKFKPGECYYGELLDSEDMVEFLESDDFTPTIDPETLPIVLELRKEITCLEKENADREQVSIDQHADLHYWRDRAREFENKLAQYEKAEQDGRLIELPVKPGSMVKPKENPDLSPQKVDCVCIYADGKINFAFHEYGLKMRYVDEWSEDDSGKYAIVDVSEKEVEQNERMD